MYTEYYKILLDFDLKDVVNYFIKKEKTFKSKEERQQKYEE